MTTNLGNEKLCIAGRPRDKVDKMKGYRREGKGQQTEAIQVVDWRVGLLEGRWGRAKMKEKKKKRGHCAPDRYVFGFLGAVSIWPEALVRISCLEHTEEKERVAYTGVGIWYLSRQHEHTGSEGVVVVLCTLDWTGLDWAGFYIRRLYLCLSHTDAYLECPG